MAEAYALAVSGVVGREAELEAVHSFLDHPAPVALAIVGEPGIGKTTIWTRAVEAARARGATAPLARAVGGRAGDGKDDDVDTRGGGCRRAGREGARRAPRRVRGSALLRR